MGQETGESLLIKNADFVVTDPTNPAIESASVSIVDNQIVGIGQPSLGSYDKIYDATGCIVTSGFVNAHHHFSQGYLRGHPDLQKQPIAKWVETANRLISHMSDEMLEDAALLGLAELVLYGCTTSADMQYCRPNGRDLLTPAISAAHQLGVRFHPYVGGVTIPESQGGNFPDFCTQPSEQVFTKIEQDIQKHHDSSPFSMLRIGIGLCGVYSNQTVDFLYAAVLGKALGVNLQTHVSESVWENDYALKRFNSLPVQHLRDLGWLGANTSLVHGIALHDEDIASLAEDGTHLISCPVSNARSPLGESGVAPIYRLLQEGVNVGLGVDGSASNDSSNLLADLKWARTIPGASTEGTYLDSDTVLLMATRNGADILGRQPEIGSIEVGKAADIAVFDLNHGVETAGTWDPLTTLTANHRGRAKYVFINGQVVVEDGKLTTIDEDRLVDRAKRHIIKLKKGEV